MPKLVRRDLFWERLTEHCLPKPGLAVPGLDQRRTNNSRRFLLPQADRMGDFVKFFAADVLEAFARGGKLFVNLDRFLGHDLVGFFRAAKEEEIRTGGQSLMAIRIKSEAEHQGPALHFSFGRVRH